jgi:predicted Na+-dependent transporter
MENIFSTLQYGKNIVIVLCAVGAGFLFPEVGQQLRPLVTPLVALLVYSSLWDTNSNTSLIRSYWSLLILFLILSYGVIPVLGIYLIDLFLSGGTRTGFAIMLAAPTTAGSAIVWTRLSNGEVQLSTVGSILSLFLAPVFTPLLLSNLLSNTVSVPAMSIITDLAIILGGGSLLYIILPTQSISERSINFLTSGGIMLLIYITVSGSNITNINSEWFTQVFFASIMLLIFGLILVILIKILFKLPYSETVSIFYISNMKNLGIAVLVSVSYTESLVLSTIVFYYVFQQFVAAIFSDIQKRKVSHSASNL